jgi:hypothetical protein
MSMNQAGAKKAAERRGYATNSTLAGINLLDHNHPTKLSYERQEPLAREAGDARLAKRPRAARRKEEPTGERRTAAFPWRVMALWGRTSVPFFRA